MKPVLSFVAPVVTGPVTPKLSSEVMVPETRAMTPESFSLVAKNDECLVSCDITSGKMTFRRLDHKPAPPYVCLMKDST